MKKYFSISLVFILLVSGSGCSRNPFRRIPQNTTGTSREEETKKSQITGNISGEITLPAEIMIDRRGRPLPNVKIRVDGVDAEIPAGSTGTLRIDAEGKQETSSIVSIITSWKLNSAPVQLMLFGGIAVAVGVGLLIFGMTKIGIACIGMGMSLIGCSILINNYPWVVLVVIGLALLIGVYFFYNQLSKKRVEGECDKQMCVLTKLCRAIDKMPKDIIDEYIKKPLKIDDDSHIIREITRRAREQ